VDSGWLDARSLSRAERLARYVAGMPGFRESDLDDIRQELLLGLVERMPCYDPARAGRGTYVRRVLWGRVCRLLRGRYCPKGSFLSRLRRLPSDSDEPHDENVKAPSQDDLKVWREQPSEPDQVLVSLTIAQVVDRLPPELRALCEKLPEMSPADAARELGLSLWKLQRRMDRIRRIFRAAGLEEES